MRLKPLMILLSTAAVVVVADQVSKALVRASIPLHQPIWLVPGFLAVNHVQNLGAAFSLFQGQRWFFIATALAVLAVVAWVWWRYRPTNLWIAAALGLAVGGAVGNLIDRLSAGTVTDFIDFRVFPVFNNADSAIVVGVAILIAWLLLVRPDEDDAGPAAAESGSVADQAPPVTPDGPAS
jgi:signal peptidase II